MPAALCISRFQFKLHAPLSSLLLMPLLVPGVVLGTAMYVFHVTLENGLDVDVLGTFYALVAGHVVIVIPWIVRLVTASLAGRRPRDRGSGAKSRRQCLGHLPAHHPAGDPARHRGRRAVRLRDLVRQSRDEPVPGRARRTTLPIVILQYLEWKIDPTIAAVSVVQILLIGIVHADHRPLREAGAGRLTWRSSTSQRLTKRYGDFHAVRDVSLDGRRRRVPGAAGPVGLRQDHDLAHGRGLHRADRRPRPARRRATSPCCRRGSATPAWCSRATRCSRI